MKPSLRSPLILLAALSLSVVAAGCKPGDKAATTPAANADKTAAGAKAIPGLPTDKDQASYMIGMAMAKQLEPAKDDIDVDVIAKAIKASLAGQKLLLTDQQAAEIAQSFGQKMQAKQLAKMMEDSKKNLAAGDTFLAQNGKRPGVQTTASGLQYQVLTEGKGAKPQSTDTVRVNYKGMLLDGKTFDSSYDRGEPATFPLDQVVPGWQEGIALMPVGSKYKFWIPSKLGYGDKGTPGGPIPPNATLVFEVELLDIAKQPAK
ncbi:FKBP-type peptidyl-prolyl cis-trans isomerase [Cognatiluteimonas profundi]|uniref:FKBP-type peptidyl-prolyl cis-trans isomerase n=1 Tax=Cognatiluteimonas profundi TaxID=2594501 RepID=UPI00131C47BC|nr:FKBP-type peptidyl-prolyl cis-trans isomerase [Lysobacter profundi]